MLMVADLLSYVRNVGMSRGLRFSDSSVDEEGMEKIQQTDAAWSAYFVMTENMLEIVGSPRKRGM
jgi:hypothetical protein